MSSQDSSKKVLLVDDEVAVRNLYQIFLEKQGLSVFTAAGVREALQALHDLHFDAAVVDLQLTDGDGMEIVRRIRQNGGPRVVAMSGYPQSERIARDLEVQNVHFYSKLDPLGELVRLLAD